MSTTGDGSKVNIDDLLSGSKTAEPENKPAEPVLEEGFVDALLGEKTDENALLELQKLLETAEGEAKKERENFLRGQAELQNVQRRSERDVVSAHKFALEKFVVDLLPVVDSLEKALEVASEQSSVSEGLELTLKMFLSSIQKFGVEVIEPQDQAFDPEWHEAMSMQVCPDKSPNLVLAVVQKGYRLNGRLLRAAKVLVSSPESGGSQDLDTKA